MSNRIEVGRIHRAVGLKGAVELELYSGDQGRLSPGAVLLVAGRPLTVVKSGQGRKGRFKVQFAEADGREAAEELRGTTIEVEEEELRGPAEGSYFHFQIMGCKVITAAGDPVGEITGIMETGANDVYLVRAPGQKKEVLIPAIRDVVLNIDIDKKIITIDPPQGLIES